LKVIDLFAGCGGFSLGFERAGFDITHAVEYDKNIAQSYIINHKAVKIIIDDIKNIDESNVFTKGEADIIIGGPPCQGFSMSGARIRKGFIDDSRNYLFKHYFNIVKRTVPRLFIMENVKGLQTMQGGVIFNEIIASFESIGYNVTHNVLNALDFGVPQNRERLIIIGVYQKDFQLSDLLDRTRHRILSEQPNFFNYTTVWDAISDLENIATETEFIPNHIATKHKDIATTRMKKVLNGKNYTSLNENIKSIHSGSYGRLEKDKPSPTITTRFDTPSAGKYTHPTLNRTLTPREAARIQSFPDSFFL